MKALFLALILVVGTAMSGCSSDPARSEYYDNGFYAGAPEAPSHPHHASVDFFNKVCSGTGGSYSCHYSNQ